MSRTGITRARLEQVAHARGFTVQESHLNIYYNSLGRAYDTTFLTVMDGMHHVIQLDADLLDPWIPESYVVQELDAYKPPVPPELLSIRLPDGQIVEWSSARIAEYQGDWTVNLATITPQELEQGIARLKQCLAHENGEKCEVCGD